jgi:ketosteroid isomerase-like protein
MAQSAGPGAVFERLLRSITGRAWSELPGLYAEDAVVEHPFDMPGPSRLEGREQIRAHFNAAAALPLEMLARNIVVHETGDPEVIVAEFDYHGRVTTTGRSFIVSQVQILRVRDGLIVASRDYVNHFALAAAFGRLPTLAAMLTNEEPSPPADGR